MRILTYVGAALAVWGLICAWYYFRQESVIFQPTSSASIGHSWNTG